MHENAAVFKHCANKEAILHRFRKEVTSKIIYQQLRSKANEFLQNLFENPESKTRMFKIYSAIFAVYLENQLNPNFLANKTLFIDLYIFPK